MIRLSFQGTSVSVYAYILDNLIDSLPFFFLLHRGMSSILLMQRRNGYGEVIHKYISADVLDKAYINKKSTLNFEKSLNIGLAESIKDILKVGPHLDTRFTNDL